MILAKPMTITVTAGNTTVLDVSQRNWQQAVSIICKPGAGTCALESSNEEIALTAPGSATWIDSGNGAMATTTEVIRYAPCKALRFTATTANATFYLMV